MRLSPDAKEKLKAQPWFGNIRELEHKMEYNMIKNAMDKYSGNLSLVASQLGISRQTLYNKIKRYEL